jgi:tetratricopeptide (TPR) repeat protein
MQARKITFTILTVFLATSLTWGQTEVLKSVVNNLALYKQKKDLKYLGNAKKSIDSVIKAAPDSTDLGRNVFRAEVNSVILYVDSLNKLGSPAVLFVQTVALVDKLSLQRKIFRYEEEINYAKQCLANVYIRKAYGVLGKADYVNALKLFQNAQNYAPGYKPITGYIAYCDYKLGHLNSAAQLYSQLIESNTASAEYVETASNIYKTLGDTTMALSIVEKGRKLLPLDKSILLDEANIFTNKRDYQSLYPLLPSLLDTYTNNADVEFVAANCYDHLNQYDKAIAYYLKAIDINSSAYEPIFNLGVLLLKKSEINLRGADDQDLLQAGSWLEKANEISPNDVKCLKALEMVYTKTGNQDQINKINNKLNQLNNQ